MKRFEAADHHSDARRDLTAFRPPADFPHVTEAKILCVKEEGITLGRQYRPHAEGFFLAVGSCVVNTWSEKKGLQTTPLSGPIMFSFEPHEEHALVCSKGMILIGYMPVTFENENNTPATHL